MDNLKLVLRMVHLTSSGFLAGCVVLNYYYGINEFLAHDPNFSQFAYPLASVLALVSGLANVFVLKPNQDKGAPPKSKISSQHQPEETE